VLAASLCVSAAVVHVLAAAVWRLPIPTGLIATAQLGVPAAVASIGLSSSLITPGQGAAILTMIPITLLVAAIGSVVLGGRAQITDASAPIV